MKKFIVIVSASLLALPLLGQEKSPQLKDQKDKVSYSIGMNIGFNLSRQKVDVNPDIVAADIKEWTEGVQLMKTGSKYQFFVPANLGYGERAVSPDIGANATLIFEVELLEIKPPATPAPPSSAPPQGPKQGAPPAPPKPTPK